MSAEYIGIGAAFFLAAVVAVSMVILASTLGKKKPTQVKLESFECGNSPIALPGGKVAIKFYLTAILFILFDVELVFLYPWAVVYRELGLLGLGEMGPAALGWEECGSPPWGLGGSSGARRPGIGWGGTRPLGLGCGVRLPGVAMERGCPPPWGGCGWGDTNITRGGAR
ncbi:MAG: NADH-quinone oxidoreductase subunit A, partial [Planctomycetaceae bacterium]